MKALYASTTKIILCSGLCVLAGCGGGDHESEVAVDRLLPGPCAETYTRSDPGDLDRVLESRNTWEGDRLKGSEFWIDGAQWGEVSFFYLEDGRVDYRIDLGTRVDYIYEDGVLVETVSSIDRTEFSYDEQGRLILESVYAIEGGTESFANAFVYTYDGATVIRAFDGDQDHATTGAENRKYYRSAEHRILEREEDFDAAKVRETETIYSLDEYGNPRSGVREDFKADERNLQGTITFDYACFR